MSFYAPPFEVVGSYETLTKPFPNPMKISGNECLLAGQSAVPASAMWRRGELVGARFVTAEQLKDGLHKPIPIGFRRGGALLSYGNLT